jgi:hypothetical protein
MTSVNSTLSQFHTTSADKYAMQPHPDMGVVVISFGEALATEIAE